MIPITGKFYWIYGLPSLTNRPRILHCSTLLLEGKKRRKSQKSHRHLSSWRSYLLFSLRYFSLLTSQTQPRSLPAHSKHSHVHRKNKSSRLEIIIIFMGRLIACKGALYLHKFIIQENLLSLNNMFGFMMRRRREGELKKQSWRGCWRFLGEFENGNLLRFRLWRLDRLWRLEQTLKAWTSFEGFEQALKAWTGFKGFEGLNRLWKLAQPKPPQPQAFSFIYLKSCFSQHSRKYSRVSG